MRCYICLCVICIGHVCLCVICYLMKPEQKGICNHSMRQERVKIALEAFTYSYIDIYDKEYFHDKKNINTIKLIFEKNVILKLGKCNGVVLMNKGDCHNAMKQLYSDKVKFKIIKSDPTSNRLKTVKNYLND